MRHTTRGEQLTYVETKARASVTNGGQIFSLALSTILCQVSSFASNT